MKLGIDQALQTLLWAGITGVVFAVFKMVFDRTIVRDLKRADDVEATLRKDVEENRLLVTRAWAELDKLKSRVETNERLVEQDLKQLKDQQTELKIDMRKGFDKMESYLKKV